MDKIWGNDSVRIGLVWLAASLLLVVGNWHRIQTLAFGDPDDVMRMKQVLDLVHGQSWWDLRQYAVDPPRGTDMHWSRLVDIPLLAVLVPCMRLMGQDDAVMVAAAVVPLVPMLVAMCAMASATRRLVDPGAGVLGAACLFLITYTTGKWTPLRVDHHGWQIALSCIMLAALVGDRTYKAGLVAGTACVMSLAIGMETAPVVAIAAVLIAFRWVETGETGEIRAFGCATLALLPVGYGAFQPWGNSHATCDALTPVWTTDGMLGAFLLLVASYLPGGIRARIAGLAGAAACVAITHAVKWPECQLPVEQVSEQAQRLWLDRTMETQPIFAVQGVSLLILGVPSLISCWVMTEAVKTGEWRRWLAPATMFAAMAAVTAWRIRGGPLMLAAATPGVTYLTWNYMMRANGFDTAGERIVAQASAPLVASGAIFPGALAVLSLLQNPSPQAARRDQCVEGRRMELLRTVPGGEAMASITMGPYVALFGGHAVPAGPYHRNADAVVGNLLDWTQPPARAHADLEAKGIGLVVACPDREETNLDGSFQKQLYEGRVPWLRPLDVPGLDPIRVWQIVPSGGKASTGESR